MIIGIAFDEVNDGFDSVDDLIDAVVVADERGFDFAVLNDTFGSNTSVGYDAELVAATLASLTTSIALVVATDTTHTEPFHLAKNLATLDLVSSGRAGWWPRVSLSENVAQLFGRRRAPNIDDARAETSDVIEVVRRLWDSWEDGAVIRDAGTGRYIDRDKVHYVDFVGTYFSVRGPSITPRSPQGQPPIWLDLAEEGANVLIGQADVVVVDGLDSYQERRRDIRAELAAAGRDASDVRVIAAVRVAVPGTPVARQRDTPTSNFSGSPGDLVEWLRVIDASADVDGVVLHSSRDAATLARLGTIDLSVLGSRSRENTSVATLRGQLGLERPASRYATTP
jgi:alkanesulfonate monooxygenase SsuD/methylene tetrahydromethanopterin reductase-like flavin-dependent oxidoreductase (luciferase family)